MRQKATEPLALTVPQECALAALLAGSSVTEAAAAAGVARQTVHGWLREDFTFQAAYNQGRRELTEAHSARLHALTTVALDAVEAALRAGDAKAALTVLRGVGLLSGEPIPIGADDADELREEDEMRRAHTRWTRDLEKTIAGM